ncbi:hypothetical protein JKP88DRAFT_334512 [Tribonema minus]|uniref:Uncharacterized protein n=1 Tax=Tribonema minus TaxID=303371 RepID=A0A835YKF5_9STRA|nr:hypothetical protein JKP88DRAFT_334512 [Tribonema minus]
MRLRLKPAVRVRLSEKSLIRYSAICLTTRILELSMIDMMGVPLLYFPKYLRKWTVLQSVPLTRVSIPNVERVDVLYIEDDSKGGTWLRQLLEGLLLQRCSIGSLHLDTDLCAEAARPTAFPEGLERLVIYNDSAEVLQDTGTADGTAILAVPDSVKDLQLDAKLVPARVPSALLHLKIMCGESSEQLQYVADIEGLQTLTLDECTRTAPMVYPSNLRSLTIEESCDDSDPSLADIGSLPAGLKTLRIVSLWIHHLLGELPVALEALDLRESRMFNQPLGKLPEGLKTLHLGPAFTQELGRLPPSLIELTVPMQYPHALAVPAGTRVTLCKGT